MFSLFISTNATPAVMNSDTVTVSQIPSTPKSARRRNTNTLFKITPRSSVIVKENRGLTVDWKYIPLMMFHSLTKKQRKYSRIAGTAIVRISGVGSRNR